MGYIVVCQTGTNIWNELTACFKTLIHSVTTQKPIKLKYAHTESSFMQISTRQVVLH